MLSAEGAGWAPPAPVVAIHDWDLTKVLDLANAIRCQRLE